jgi:predicted metal-dependent peptidase
MANQQLVAEKRIQRAHVWIMRSIKYMFLSGVVQCGNVYVVDGDDIPIPTAGTDGWNVWYCREFVDSMTDKQLLACVLHENYHKAFRHMLIWKKLFEENAQKANIATDCVINNMLTTDPDLDCNWPMPARCIFDHQYDTWDTRQIYDIIKDPPQQPQGGSSGKPQKPDNTKPTDVPNSMQGMQQGMDFHDWAKAKGMSEKEIEAMEQKIDQALRQGGILAGKMGGDMSREIKELLKPKVDWRSYLQEFLTQVAKGRDDMSWSKMNRRKIGDDQYWPGYISTSFGRLGVFIDLSGSVCQELAQVFLSEFVQICKELKPEEVTLAYWDGDCYPHETYYEGEWDDILQRTKPRGGGGTVPSCFTNYIKEKGLKYEAVIVLTDGYVGSDWGDWYGIDCPVLWGICGDKTAIPSHGIGIQIEE